MKLSFLLLSVMLCVTVGCQNRRYDRSKYEVKTSTEASSLEDGSRVKLHDNCLSFLNYCDENYSSDLKKFARDWLRTWGDWETDGIRTIGGNEYCNITTKSRYGVRSINLSYYKDRPQQSFEAELNVYGESYKYDDLLVIIKDLFGDYSVVEPIHTKKGIRHKWNVDKIKMISTTKYDSRHISLIVNYNLY